MLPTTPAPAVPEPAPIDQIETRLHDAGKVAGALRAVACMTRPWRAADHPMLEMTRRADLADLLDMLGGALAGHLQQLDHQVARSRGRGGPQTVY